MREMSLMNKIVNSTIILFCLVSEVNTIKDKMIIHLMPSEISRLVLGYLRETDCKETAKLFVKESKHLTEYANGLKNGINYSTNIGGKSLIDVINTYCCLQNKDNAKQSEDKSIENKSNAELNRLSKQLSKIETLLNKLMQMTTNGQNSINQSNYRLVGSPPLISTSSPLFINTIGLNSTPILSNQTSKTNQNKDRVADTPSKTDNSPRRKRTPRRRHLSGSSPFMPSANSSIDDFSDQTLVNTSSDQLRDESEPQLRIDINEPLVQPEFIVEELINFEPLHDVLADNINKIFISSNTIANCQQNKEPIKRSHNESNDQNLDPTEIRINDELVSNILSSLESAPEYNTILDIITEKELQMTPYKNLSSVETTSSSASSLNTPQTPLIRVNAQKGIENTNPVVKNLMTDLRTPEKTVTLYAARSPSETRITPVKVTPVKVFRTELSPDFNFVLNDKNVPIIVPKVSLVGQDFELFTNSIVNSTNTYSVSVQSNSNQNHPLVKSVPSIARKRMGKNVNFEKPAAELQVKRSDLIPRKILPKPVNSNRSTTTITPVCADAPIESVSKHTLVLTNNNSETNEQNESKSDSKSPKSLLSKEKNGKRPNTGGNESSPLKIMATDVRFPTVNILRKMNVNKMDQFLKQIHSNKTD